MFRESGSSSGESEGSRVLFRLGERGRQYWEEECTADLDMLKGDDKTSAKVRVSIDARWELTVR